jgi:hypothetical protein
MKAFFNILGILLALVGAVITLIYCFADYIGWWGGWAWAVLGSIGYLMINTSGKKE